MNKKNIKYYVLIALMVIVSMSIPISAQANSSSNAEQNSSDVQNNIDYNDLWNSMSEQANEIFSKQNEKNAQKNEEFESRVAAKHAEFEKKEKKTLSIIIPLIVLVVGGAIIFNVIIYRKAFKDNKSSKTTFVPFQPITRDNETHMPINAVQKIEGKCMYCGKDISSDSEFCNHCGKKQAEEYIKIFNRQRMNNDEFIASINSWLANNPKIANVKCEFNTRTSFGLLVNKYLLDSVALKYELFKNNNENQYGIVELKKFGLYRKSSDALLAEWQAHNPNAVVLKQSGGSHSRGEAGHELFGGIGASNNTQLFVFFKFKRNQ